MSDGSRREKSVLGLLVQKIINFFYSIKADIIERNRNGGYNQRTLKELNRIFIRGYEEAIIKKAATE